MTDRESVMTVFAGTNGAGKSTISFQMRDYVAEIKRSQISFCRDEIPTWARGALELYLY
ncbi:hypothetical protein D3C73_929370 [compost metagenome]